VEVQFAFAFTAGLVSTINPCGFAMLPAYLAYFVGSEDQRKGGHSGAVMRALLVGAVVSAGFLSVFGIAGALLGAGVQAIQGVIGWLAMGVGAGVIVLGVAMIRGFELRARLPSVSYKGGSRGLRRFYVFGVSYAVASLSCCLPIFLVVVTVSLGRAGFVSAAATSLVYAVGMSILLMAVTLAVALGKQSVIAWLKRSSRYVSRISGFILILAGIYIIFFWVSVLATGGLTDSPVIRSFELLQARLVNAIGDSATAIGAILAAVLVVATLYAVLGRERRSDREEAEVPTELP
jgi:cytochrome c-type biogenesis protein